MNNPLPSLCPITVVLTALEVAALVDAIRLAKEDPDNDGWICKARELDALEDKLMSVFSTRSRAMEPANV